METGMLHLHVTAVTFFLFFLLIKTLLLLANKENTLAKIREKTKVLDIILGVTILLTGGYMLTLKSGIPTYMVVKIILVFIAIPLGIVGLKREKKLLAVASLLIFAYIYGVAETQSYKFKKDKVVLSTPEKTLSNGGAEALVYGEELYKKLCVECHGEDGKKGLYKATDLTESQLTVGEQKQIILKGKKVMPSFKELDEEQVNALTGYLQTMRK
ncbi:SirB2 family protein [Xanthovirga aplysinae]|uniref:SirB2 family protein n=1 Tax=Xanthovirga aplysinae TaxID=2529853 RepID=UPI0012BD5612|nr:SirB2 family protein [Xanthovirga aplysinae]MTI32509.1 cytochrome C [Xanthovirga aplysinae]